jgi:hypothetical protein
MAEKIRDAEDQLLESMFRSEPIEDAGFSDRIIGRIRRGIWLRRLSLPVAMLIGGAIAIKPLLQLGSVAANLSKSIPAISIGVPDTMLAQLPIALSIGCLVLIGIVTFKLSEE